MLLPSNAATPAQNTDCINSSTSFLSPVLLSVWNRALLRPHDLLPLLWSPFPFSLIDQWVSSGLQSFSPRPLSFFWVVGVETLFTPFAIMSSDMAGLHRLLPAETHVSLQLLSSGSLLFTYLVKPRWQVFFFFLSPKDVAETSFLINKLDWMNPW